MRPGINAQTLLKLLPALVALSGCDNYRKDDYHDNSPTSGQLKVYYDEGLELHVKNQALTFESQYYKAHLELRAANDDEAVLAMYNDSCKAIVVSRLLNDKEKAMFASRSFTPAYSKVAYSAVALVTSTETPITFVSREQLKNILVGKGSLRDSSGNNADIRIVIDRNNSSVMRYLTDSVMRSNTFGPACSSMGSSPETIRYAANNRNVIGIVDFAWLSDRDDEFYKSVENNIRFLAVGDSFSAEALPNQSTFKLETYPFTRPVYVIRNTGDFTLAKGFESFVAGPKGQLTFLKQGLLPARQGERNIEVNLE